MRLERKILSSHPPHLFSEPLSSVSSLEVHFDLLDLTELTDMSDQELAEVFADSDEENAAREPPAGKWPLPKLCVCLTDCGAFSAKHLLCCE